MIEMLVNCTKQFNPHIAGEAQIGLSMGNVFSPLIVSSMEKELTVLCVWHSAEWATASPRLRFPHVATGGKQSLAGPPASGPRCQWITLCS